MARIVSAATMGQVAAVEAQLRDQLFVNALDWHPLRTDPVRSAIEQPPPPTWGGSPQAYLSTISPYFSPVHPPDPLSDIATRLPAADVPSLGVLGVFLLCEAFKTNTVDHPDKHDDNPATAHYYEHVLPLIQGRTPAGKPLIDGTLVVSALDGPRARSAQFYAELVRSLPALAYVIDISSWVTDPGGPARVTIPDGDVSTLLGQQINAWWTAVGQESQALQTAFQAAHALARAVVARNLYRDILDHTNPSDPLYPGRRQQLSAAEADYAQKSSAAIAANALPSDHMPGLWKWTPPPAPIVASITPDEGPLSGGTQVIVTGEHFAPAIAVTIGGMDIPGFRIDSDTQITFPSPPWAAGAAVDVRVTSRGGPSAANPGDEFIYRATPSITGLSVGAGPAAGGTPVVITGSGFMGATAVSFGGTPAAQFVVDHDGQISAVTPPGSGTVDVTVTSAGGTSPTGPSTQFIFAPVPTLTGIAPFSGPEAGGTTVTIMGSGLATTSEVRFLATPLSFTVIDDAHVNIVTPTGTGTVPITVATAGGSAAGPAFQYFVPSANPITRIFRIHPPIGVARVGDADPTTDSNAVFDLPEDPGTPFSGPFRSGGKIRRQAAVFHIFEYAPVGGRLTPIRHISLLDPDIDDIEWEVHLANRKAYFFEFNGRQGENVANPNPRRNAGAAADWEIDPLPRKISKANLGGPLVEFSPATSPSGSSWPKVGSGAPAISSLGFLQIYSDGRLRVIGGAGKSLAKDGTTGIATYANNPQWLDDISDGPVKAVVKVKTAGGIVAVPAVSEGRAWCLVAPPDFAPPVESVVTLYDTLFDVAARFLAIPDEPLFDGPLRDINAELRPSPAGPLTAYKPHWPGEIEPILRRALLQKYVFGSGQFHVTWGGSPPPADLSNPAINPGSTRSSIFNKLRKPHELPGGGGNDPTQMPKAFGDDYEDMTEREFLALTVTQYRQLERWRNGNFNTSPVSPFPPLLAQVERIDRAPLQASVGGAFYPGIEASWQIRNPILFVAPFRVNHNATSQYNAPGEAGTPIRAGHFSRQMACPWQADFKACTTETRRGEDVAWWPAQRPQDVDVPGMTPLRQAWARGVGPGMGPAASMRDMVDKWKLLGFVVKTPAGAFIEDPATRILP